MGKQVEAQKTISLFPDGSPDRRALESLMEIYGDETTEGMLNSLHALAARVGVASGVTADKFAEGVKHHWDFVATSINEFKDTKPLENRMTKLTEAQNAITLNDLEKLERLMKSGTVCDWQLGAPFTPHIICGTAAGSGAICAVLGFEHPHRRANGQLIVEMRNKLPGLIALSRKALESADE